MNNQPNPEDIEYLTQLTYSIIPEKRIILIEPHWFDLEILALWIRINPSNPLTRAQLTNLDIWSIIINYNNYLDSSEPVLTEIPKRFNYTPIQFEQITNAINTSFNNNIDLPLNIVNLITNIRTGHNYHNNHQHQLLPNNINLLPPSIQRLINGNVGTNCIHNFEIGSQYIYIDNHNGIIGRTDHYTHTIDRIPYFGDNNLPMELTRYIFYIDTNPDLPVEEFPRPIEFNNFVIGTRYFGLTYNDTFFGKFMPFIGFCQNHNNDPEFSFEDNRGSAIFNRDYHYFYDPIQLNQMGINSVNE
jgi:hypothetical protein